MNAPCTMVDPVSSMFGEVTQLLQRLAGGDKTAENELIPHVYMELHRLAAFYRSREKPWHTWQVTDIVNEAYVKLAGISYSEFHGRSHFFGVAAQIMRRILTDHARRKLAEKRGGNELVVPLDDNFVIANEQCDLIANLDEALQRLEVIDPRAAKVVELRFFGGLNDEEIAALLGVSSRSVTRFWQTARAWLFGQLVPGRDKSDG